jgi:hypothetical protein
MSARSLFDLALLALPLAHRPYLPLPHHTRRWKFLRMRRILEKRLRFPKAGRYYPGTRFALDINPSVRMEWTVTLWRSFEDDEGPPVTTHIQHECLHWRTMDVRVIYKHWVSWNGIEEITTRSRTSNETSVGETGWSRETW